MGLTLRQEILLDKLESDLKISEAKLRILNSKIIKEEEGEGFYYWFYTLNAECIELKKQIDEIYSGITKQA